jgi:hypothetical protein
MVVTALWVLFGADIISGNVTSYSATCLQKGHDGRCDALGRTMDPVVFEIAVTRQQVHALTEDGHRRRLKSCVVTSKKDWHCRSSTDDSFELGYREGQPWLRIKGSEETDLVFLPRWQYLWLKSGEPHGELVPKRFRFRP